jgi:ribonuclease HI
VFIETDGAWAGNPEPGGWGCILAQNGKRIEAYASRAETTNNEMELTAINEGLAFLPNARAYAVIEPDSEGCLKTMMADNYFRLDGSKVASVFIE